MPVMASKQNVTSFSSEDDLEEEKREMGGSGKVRNTPNTRQNTLYLQTYPHKTHKSHSMIHFFFFFLGVVSSRRFTFTRNILNN